MQEKTEEYPKEWQYVAQRMCDGVSGLGTQWIMKGTTMDDAIDYAVSVDPTIWQEDATDQTAGAV